MPVVKRCDELRDASLKKTLPDRETLAEQLLELDKEVGEAVTRAKAAGFTSGYLKPLVVSRINPLRWVKEGEDGKKPDLAKTLTKMIEGAKKFDASKLKAADVAASAWMGGGDE